MKEEVIQWGNIIQIPDPETTLTIFLHLVVHYWRAENNPEYYRTHFFPQDVGSVLLRVDHHLYQKIRYHLYEVNKEDYIGVWDQTPYHLDFRHLYADRKDGDGVFLDHGDYRHEFQLFLRSFLKEIKKHMKYYPSLDRLYKILSHFPLLQWKCPVCRLYNDWSRGFIETFLLEKNVSISPSSLLYLLTCSNKKIHEPIPDELKGQHTSLNELLVSALGRFFVHFEKIYEQTSTEPIIILDQLITILEKYASVYTIDQIHEFENQCARDMKNYLYDQFKFLRTKTIQIHHFPRDMMIIRDIFAMMVGIWSASSLPDGSPGILMLLYNMLFQDKALGQDLQGAQPLVVFHSLEDALPITRHMTPKEINVFTDYHPLLRQTIFKT
jgi:hypothetical protein